MTGNKRCFRIVLHDYENDYETFVKKSNKSTMEVVILRTLALEIFKTISKINPSYMKKVFAPKTDERIRSNDILVKLHNFTNYDDRNLLVFGSKIWNRLPQNIKSETYFNKCKEYLDTWFGH